MVSEVVSCPLCAEFQAPTIQLPLPHIRLVHSSQPGFCITCGLHGCQRTFRNMKTFTNHIYQFHLISRVAAISSQSTDSDNDSDDDEVESEYDSLQENLLHVHAADQSDHPTDTLQKEVTSFAATWILKIREAYKLT